MLDGSFDRVLSRSSGGLTQGAVIFEVHFVEPLVGRRVIWEGLVDSCIGEDIVRITVHERRFDLDDGAGFLREIRRVADFAGHEVNHRAQDVLFGWVFLRRSRVSIPTSLMSQSDATRCIFASEASQSIRLHVAFR